VEEPDLGQHEREPRQRDRNRASSGDHERHEPDQVLRREDLREGEEAGHSGGEGKR